MYIHAPEFRAYTIDGWSYVTTGAKVSLDVHLDPATLTKSGASTIRTWLRRGYCGRLRGMLPSYWTSLMYLMNARFIMKDDGNASYIRIFDDSIFAKIKDNNGEFAAMFKLLRAVHTPTDCDNSRLSMNVSEAENLQTVMAATGRRQAGMVWFYGGYAKAHIDMRDQFLRIFGPPVEEPDHGLALFKQEHRLTISLDQQACDELPHRRTTCKIFPS